MRSDTITFKLCFFLFILAPFVRPQADVHIVYLGNREDDIHPDVVTGSHYALLESVLGSAEAAKESLIYSYRHGFSGFAVRLTPQQAAQISALPNVISTFISKHRQLHTTNSWEFLGISGSGETPLSGNSNASLWENGKYGRDVIIGVLDTGIWPESESFSDHDMGPVPARWKGACELGEEVGSFKCNKKLIGARFYASGFINETYLKDNSELRSPRDVYNHGAHCASTAGGNFVKNANWFGYANGVAKGGAPMSRIAAYKVCWQDVSSPAGQRCPDAFILKAFDDGIHDGVDIFSVSLGGGPSEYITDPIALGAFHAMQKGITVVASGGNDGNEGPASVANVAPWIITVAASSISRRFKAEFTLGDNTSFQGLVIADKHKLDDNWYPMVLSVNAGLRTANLTARRFCFDGSLDPKKVNGKVVVCMRWTTLGRAEANAVLKAGGAGMILCNPKRLASLELQQEFAPLEGLSAVYVNAKDGEAVLSYINSTTFPEVRIFQTTTELGGKEPAPVMASFSSQGPNIVTPQILKPDITAPGVNILAAISQAKDNRTRYGFQSGTSMSCPHVSGVAALLKIYRPDWSPAAIKSALVTTAHVTDNLGEAIKNSSLVAATPFYFGGGHIDPNAAAHPGLVYDADEQDYTAFLCSLNFSSNAMKLFTQNRSVKCPQSGLLDASDLNYPSISIAEFINSTKTVTRRVTNVDDDATTYRETVKAPFKGVSVSVHPSELVFKRRGEVKSFKVEFKLTSPVPEDYVFGSLTWSNGKYSAIKNCGRNRDLAQARRVHAEVSECAAGQDRLLANLLVEMYGKCGCVREARHVFDRIPNPNVFSWTLVLAAYANNGHLSEARSIFDRMPEQNAVSWTTMVTAYARHGEVSEAVNLFEVMPCKTSVSWNSILAVYAHNRMFSQAKDLFKRMPRPDLVSWNEMLSCCVKCSLMSEALQMFNEMPQRDAVSWNTVLTGHVDSGDFQAAVSMFREMPAKNIVSWTLMIQGYAGKGRVSHARMMFNQIPQRSTATWHSMLSGNVLSGHFEDAKVLFDEMPEHNVAAFNWMLISYAQSGHTEDLRFRFDTLPECNIVSWTILLTSCTERLEDVKSVFDRMPEWNSVSCTVMMYVYARRGYATEAKFLFDQLLDTETIAWNVMISAYAQGGYVDKAKQILCRAPERNLVAWTAVITSYAWRGHAQASVDIFYEMQVEGVKVDSVVFIPLLSVCSHSGCVTKTNGWFESMIVDYNVKASKDHYCCLVDGFSRAGHGETARNVVQLMPGVPDFATQVAMQILNF